MLHVAPSLSHWPFSKIAGTRLAMRLAASQESFAVRFRGVALVDSTPDYPRLSNTRCRLPIAVFEEVFRFVRVIAQAPTTKFCESEISEKIERRSEFFDTLQRLNSK